MKDIKKDNAMHCKRKGTILCLNKILKHYKRMKKVI